MKKIDSIIRRLKEGDEVSPEELRIAGYLLDEMRRMEKHENELITMQMSPEMYHWFMENAYDREGNVKPGTFQVKPLQTVKH
jgi:cell division protein YceG involved in septum cleavage